MVLLDQRLRNEPALRPQRGSSGAAAYDLRACVPTPLTLSGQQVHVISTGIAIHIRDSNLCGILAPRSGLGIRVGIVLANLVGVIDSDYTGEIKAGIWNRGHQDFVLEPYSRLCQLLIIPVVSAQLQVVDAFSSTSARSDNGFGSTGVS